MTASDDAVLAQVQEILEEAEAKVTTERTEGLYKEFQGIEQSMWENLGACSDIHTVYGVRIVPNDQVDDALIQVEAGNAELVVGDGTLDGKDADTLVRLQAMAECGNIYEALDDHYFRLIVARDSSIVGLLLRLAVSSTEADDGTSHDATLTMLLLADHVYVGVRHHTEPDKPMYKTIHAEDYEGGDKLVDVLLNFFVVTRAMYQENQEIMEAWYQDLSHTRGKEETNKSKEDKQ